MVSLGILHLNEQINSTYFIGLKARKLESYLFLFFMSYTEAIVKFIAENIEVC